MWIFKAWYAAWCYLMQPGDSDAEEIDGEDVDENADADAVSNVVVHAGHSIVT